MKSNNIEVVINNQYGGFSLSREAFLELRKMGNEHALREPDIGEFWPDGSGPRSKYSKNFYLGDIPRNDKDLVEVVKKLKRKANGSHSSLKIVKIPADVKWQIEEYDGREWISEIHRTWS